MIHTHKMSVSCPICQTYHAITVQSINFDGMYRGAAKCDKLFTVYYHVSDGTPKVAFCSLELFKLNEIEQLFVFSDYCKKIVADKLRLSVADFDDEGRKPLTVFGRNIIYSLVRMKFPTISYSKISKIFAVQHKHCSIIHSLKQINNMMTDPTDGERRGIYLMVKEYIFCPATQTS